MPTNEQALSLLQTLFPGQLVLYPNQLAQVLGRSEKSLKHLIDRGNLPFGIKKVGNRRCADVLSVAEWLARDPDESQIQLPQSPVKPAKARVSRDSASSRTSMAGMLMEMRHRTVSAMRRSLTVDLPPDDSAFITEFVIALTQQPADERLRVEAEMLAKQVGSQSARQSQRFAAEFGCVLDAADCVVDIMQKPTVSGSVTVIRDENPICSYSRQDDGGGWKQIGVADLKLSSAMQFIEDQVLDLNEAALRFTDERVLKQWFDRQSIETKREIRALCQFSVEAEFFRQLMRERSVISCGTCLPLYYEAWARFSGRIVFDLAVSRFDCPEKLEDFLDLAYEALPSPEAVTEFEECFRAFDDLEQIQSWLRDLARSHTAR